jgi:hypothetical protein
MAGLIVLLNPLIMNQQLYLEHNSVPKKLLGAQTNPAITTPGYSKQIYEKMTSRNFGHFLTPLSPSSRFLFVRPKCCCNKILYPSPYDRDVIYGRPKTFFSFITEECHQLLLKMEMDNLKIKFHKFGNIISKYKRA